MKILFVCLGNICRSPMADGILRKLCKTKGLDWEVDSAGTGHWHIGEPPDRRAIETAASRNVDISGLRARQFQPADLQRFDRIYVMDSENYRDILSQCTSRDEMVKVDWLLNLSEPGKNRSVPDPYMHSGMFDEVFDQIEAACNTLIQIES